MKLSTKSRYAVMAMVDLAKQSTGEPIALADVADRQEISLSYLEQIFGKLRRGGLVNSVRGPGGGYMLSRSSADTRISDIILAVDVTSTTQSKTHLNNIYDILDQTISVHGYEKKINSIKLADYYIRPEIETISFTDYKPSTMQYLFNKGEKAVLDNWHIFLKIKEITKNRGQKTKNLKQPFLTE